MTTTQQYGIRDVDPTNPARQAELREELGPVPALRRRAIALREEIAQREARNDRATANPKRRAELADLLAETFAALNAHPDTSPALRRRAYEGIRTLKGVQFALIPDSRPPAVDRETSPARWKDERTELEKIRAKFKAHVASCGYAADLKRVSPERRKAGLKAMADTWGYSKKAAHARQLDRLLDILEEHAPGARRLPHIRQAALAAVRKGGVQLLVTEGLERALKRYSRPQPKSYPDYTAGMDDAAGMSKYAELADWLEFDELDIAIANWRRANHESVNAAKAARLVEAQVEVLAAAGASLEELGELLSELNEQEEFALEYSNEARRHYQRARRLQRILDTELADRREFGRGGVTQLESGPQWADWDELKEHQAAEEEADWYS